MKLKIISLAFLTDIYRKIYQWSFIFHSLWGFVFKYKYLSSYPSASHNMLELGAQIHVVKEIRAVKVGTYPGLSEFLSFSDLRYTIAV